MYYYLYDLPSMIRYLVVGPSICEILIKTYYHFSPFASRPLLSPNTINNHYIIKYIFFRMPFSTDY